MPIIAEVPDWVRLTMKAELRPTTFVFVAFELVLPATRSKPMLLCADTTPPLFCDFRLLGLPLLLRL